MKKIIWITVLCLIVTPFETVIARHSNAVRAQKDARAVQDAEKKADKELEDACKIPKCHSEAEASYKRTKDDE